MVGNIESPEFQAFDRRMSNRQIAIIRLSKVGSSQAEGWGLIKNISSIGIMVEIHPSFEIDRTVSITLTDEVELVGSIRWRKGSLAGIQFKKAINVNELLTNLTIHKNGRSSRLPRVQMKQAINLSVASKWEAAEICNISPAGICIMTRNLFELGSETILSIPELGDITGTVRWQKSLRVGIMFSERISIAELMIWLSAYFAKVKNGSVCRQIN